MTLSLVEEAIQKAEEMKINLEELKAGKANIAVIGLGGAGGNAINWLYNKGVRGASVFAANTDALHLNTINADEKILLGKDLCRGLGAGGKPEVGREAAKESAAELKKLLSGRDMVFVVAGEGGGTGTGSAPVAAQIAKDAGAIVIGVVTMPFNAEKVRIEKAEFGLQELREYCDTVIVIDNNKLVEVAGDLPLDQAFGVANEIIATMIKGIVEIITVPSLVNIDFADIAAIMKKGEVAVIGIGESDTQSRVEEAVRQALNHPLLEVDYKGGKGAIIHITCGPDYKMEELNKTTSLVAEHLAPDANVIFGVRVDESFKNKVRVITIVTGVKSPYILGKTSEAAEQKVEMSEELGIEILR